MGILFALLFVTTRANMLERDICIRQVFVRALLLAASLAVKFNTDILCPHVGLGDAVDEISCSILPIRRLSTASTTAIATSVGLGRTAATLEVFLVRDGLEGVGVLSSEVFQPFIDGVPGVGPLEGTHLPRHVNGVVYLNHSFVFVTERHCYQKLNK